MNYEIINSSSNGICVIVNDIVAINMGVSFKKIQPFYQKLQLVFISHCHNNYLNKDTIKKLAKLRPTLKFFVAEYLIGELLALGISKNRIDICIPNVEYDYGTFLKIKTFTLAPSVENMGIKLFMNNKKFIYATETKKIELIEDKDYDVCLIETNYENEEELRYCAYILKYENRAKDTPLSKEQTIKWLLKNRGDNSIYEFKQQQEKLLEKKFEILKPILNKAGEITKTEYELTAYGLYSCIEELINAYEHKVEELELLEQDIMDNYRPLTKAEQYE